MPEITAIGWFHTVVGIIAILSGTYSLWMHREITLESKTGQVYLVTTLVTAATALAIYQFGSFGVAHGLAVLTLVALLAGYMASITTLFGGWSCYLRAVSWTSTLFFHSLPAVTDALMRLPREPHLFGATPNRAGQAGGREGWDLRHACTSASRASTASAREMCTWPDGAT